MTEQIAIVILLAMWAVWGAYWFVLSFSTKRTVYTQPRWQRWLYFLTGAVIFLVFQLVPGAAHRLFPFSAPIAVVGIAIAVTGFAICMWARAVLGRNWSGVVTLKENHELITAGPYRFVRHPIYTGILLAVAGTLLALTPSPGGIVTLLILVPSFYRKLRQEEALMLQQFPEAYPAYRIRVRARLIPFVL